MNLLERVLTLLRANVNSMVEKADDPEKVLKQLQLDMRNQLVQVKTQVATAIATSHKLQSRSKEQVAEGDQWMKKAEQAIQQNNDDAARTALMRYNDITRLIERYQQQLKEQEQLVVTMRGALRQLEAKISEVDATVELLATRKRNATMQQRVFGAMNKTGTQQEKERTARAQDAIMEAEARAQALAELHQRDLDGQLEMLSKDQAIEQQLNALKAKKRRSHVPPLLHEGNPHNAALIPPLARDAGPTKEEAETPVDEQPLSPSPGTIEQIKKLLDLPQNSS